MSQERIYMYPKTSCDCFQCTNEDYKFPTKGTPSNLAVRDCDVSTYYDCQNRHVKGFHNAVSNKSGIEPINPQAYEQQYATNFDKIECKEGGCPTTQYASWDPRLYSSVHDQYLTFDRPPLDSKVPLSEIYDEKFRGYGKCYSTYSDINTGNIMYYTDKSREDPYYSPLFAQPARVATVVYKDPMGAMKTEYPRIVKQPKLVGNDNCDNDGYCLSWMRDTQQYREDMLASQMSKINQQRWMPRWANE